LTWNFDDLVKGHVTQTLLSTMLAGVGYTVHRLGVEEIVPELRGPNNPKVREHLPERLRFIPDLLVIDPETGDVYLVEVKFRVSTSEDVFLLVLREIEDRRRYWPEAQTILLRAEPRVSRGYHQDHIRVITPELKVSELKRSISSPPGWWEGLPQLQDVFRRIFDRFDNQQIADSITQVLRDLSTLEPPKSTF